MRILITGGSGMVGSALKEVLPQYSYDECLFLSSGLCDLRDRTATNSLFHWFKPTHVIHLAGRIGGVKANSLYPVEFFSDNIRINTNVVDASAEHNVERLIAMLSTCIYPNNIEYPIKANTLHNGPPHDSNFAYAYAKRMLQVHIEAYRRQYCNDFISVVANNLYGIKDNFDLDNSHVVPAVIRKIYEAKIIKNNKPIFWGTGNELREFTYAGDIAKILKFLLNKGSYHHPKPLNIGNTQEISIKELINTVCNIFEYDDKINFNNTYSGQHRKPSDNSPFLKIYPFKYTSLKDGLKKTCEWFKDNFPQNIRIKGYK